MPARRRPVKWSVHHPYPNGFLEILAETVSHSSGPQDQAAVRPTIPKSENPDDYNEDDDHEDDDHDVELLDKIREEVELALHEEFIARQHVNQYRRDESLNIERERDRERQEEDARERVIQLAIDFEKAKQGLSDNFNLWKFAASLILCFFLTDQGEIELLVGDVHYQKQLRFTN
ncbi:hypothetical protein N7456_001387 [Penicillium angulare]|uniref:Uncharacterized protein n=1 Tax=Penicillium angulare TaxID=116970 RepID=A0A9W9GDX3_9EURO|nr:hypothetical protein N7456_001387 [Penicillium angulare]